ncbi:MAG: glycosyltransferase family 2 protein [Nitrospiraceae bacterium]
MKGNTPGGGPKQSGPDPIVSIIVPAYNTAAYISDTLDSVFAQTRTDYEVIVINDGSPDTEGLERVLLRYRERIHYIKQENRGLSGARNTGIRATRAPLIALLDSDDIWEPDYLAVQVGAMERDPTIDVMYANALVFGDAPEAGRTFMELCPSEGQVTFEALVTGRCTVMVSTTIRREAILRAGMFDESLRGSEDFDLWLRLIKQGGKIAYHRQVLIRYRRRGGSLMTDMVAMAKEQLRVLEKASQMTNLTPAETDVVGRQTLRIRALHAFHEGKRSFLKGDVKSAIDQLGHANTYLKSRRMAFILVLMRLAPGLLLRAYRLRDRFVFGTSTY